MYIKGRLHESGSRFALRNFPLTKSNPARSNRFDYYICCISESERDCGGCRPKRTRPVRTQGARCSSFARTREMSIRPGRRGGGGSRSSETRSSRFDTQTQHTPVGYMYARMYIYIYIYTHERARAGQHGGERRGGTRRLNEDTTSTQRVS